MPLNGYIVPTWARRLKSFRLKIKCNLIKFVFSLNTSDEMAVHVSILDLKRPERDSVSRRGRYIIHFPSFHFRWNVEFRVGVYAAVFMWADVV